MSVVTKTFSITFASAYKNEMKHFVGKLSIFVLQNNIIPEPGLFCQLFLHKSLIIRTTFTFYYYLLKSRSVSPLFMLPQQYLSRLNRRLMTKFRFHLWFTSRLKFRLFNWSGSFVLLLSCLKSNIWISKQHLLLFAIFMGPGGGGRTCVWLTELCSFQVRKLAANFEGDDSNEQCLLSVQTEVAG